MSIHKLTVARVVCPFRFAAEVQILGVHGHKFGHGQARTPIDHGHFGPRGFGVYYEFSANYRLIHH